MAKRYKKEKYSSEPITEAVVPTGDESKMELVDSSAVNVAIENEGLVPAEIEKLKEAVVKKYGKKAGGLAWKGTKKVGGAVYGAGSIVGMGGTGVVVGGVGGIWKASKGILKTVKDTIFSGGGDFLNLVIPKELKEGLTRGFKATREIFKEEDKKEKK